VWGLGSMVAMVWSHLSRSHQRSALSHRRPFHCHQEWVVVVLAAGPLELESHLTPSQLSGLAAPCHHPASFLHFLSPLAQARNHHQYPTVAAVAAAVAALVVAFLTWKMVGVGMGIDVGHGECWVFPLPLPLPLSIPFPH